jgi:hypothetical protein
MSGRNGIDTEAIGKILNDIEDEINKDKRSNTDEKSHQNKTKFTRVTGISELFKNMFESNKFIKSTKYKYIDLPVQSPYDKKSVTSPSDKKINKIKINKKRQNVNEIEKNNIEESFIRLPLDDIIHLGLDTATMNPSLVVLNSKSSKPIKNQSLFEKTNKIDAITTDPTKINITNNYLDKEHASYGLTDAFESI